MLRIILLMYANYIEHKLLLINFYIKYIMIYFYLPTRYVLLNVCCSEWSVETHCLLKYVRTCCFFNYLITIYVIELCNFVAFHDYSWNISFNLNKKFIVSKELPFILALISYAWSEVNFLHFHSVTNWSVRSANKVTRSA